jgi:hypothetical protein
MNDAAGACGPDDSPASSQRAQSLVCCHLPERGTEEAGAIQRAPP